MKLLVVTGSVNTSIDSVRKITNLATGKTGANVALESALRGHTGFLLTSSPPHNSISNWETICFFDFNDLKFKIGSLLRDHVFDAVVMAAAICDYVVEDFCPDRSGRFQSIPDKISGHFSEIWLRLVPAPRLVDLIRNDWGFTNKLVIFKLESGVSKDELILRAEQARIRCDANIAVANHLESAGREAWLGPSNAGDYHRVERAFLPSALLDAIESGEVL